MRGQTAPVTIREIREEDIASGFIEVLKGLTQVGDLTGEKALNILNAIRKNPLHKIYVAVSGSGRILGATTLLVEPKFIHGGRSVAHIEDVVVAKTSRTTGIGRALIEHALENAKKFGCYKCILDCDRNVVGFYKKLGFSEHGIEMRVDFR